MRQELGDCKPKFGRGRTRGVVKSLWWDLGFSSSGKLLILNPLIT